MVGKIEKIKKICIVSKIDSRGPLELAQSLGWALSDAGFEVVYEESVASELGYAGVALATLDADLLLVLGGDGSVLRAVRMMKKQIPVLGINKGQVGFLTDLEQEDILSRLREIINNPIQLDPRMRIRIECNGRDCGAALNEAVIVTSRPAKILDFTVSVNGKAIDSFRSDGLIISTPTGSTAYAMSAGGPIVDPTIEAMLLVPMSPYMLSSRPYLLNPESEVEVTLTSDKAALLVIDGQDQYEIGQSAKIIIKKEVARALFADIGRTFFEKVEQKLRQR